MKRKESRSEDDAPPSASSVSETAVSSSRDTISIETKSPSTLRKIEGGRDLRMVTTSPYTRKRACNIDMKRRDISSYFSRSTKADTSQTIATINNSD